MPNAFVLAFVYIAYFCPLHLSEESYKSEKLPFNDCSKCRVLTKSFIYWLEKTSRGKHEGGDAAWEETKLRNYAHSEMRLVEIQEKLCSDLKQKAQDECYAFAEEVESSIEKWWYLETSKDNDIFSWLCVNELRLCCPADHFGDQCQPCLVDDKNEVCSGHGKCHGGGTRKGNGSCVCDKGYDGSICDKCKINFYKNKLTNICEPCDRACNGCHGSGAYACSECASGWTLESFQCVDIDECNFNKMCKRSEHCVNTEGSYVCKPCDKSCETCLGLGSSNCSSCYSNNLLWSGKCLDADEQQQIIDNILIRGFSFCVAFTLSLALSQMFRKYICVTSIFVFSTSMLYLYLETQDGGILHAMLYSFYHEKQL